MTDKKNIFLILGLSILLILTSTLAYFLIYSGSFYNRTDSLPSNLVYDLEEDDLFIYRSFNEQTQFINFTPFDIESSVYGNYSQQMMRIVKNNSNYVENNMDYCNITYDEYRSYFSDEFRNNIINATPNDNQIDVEIGNMSLISREIFPNYYSINMTSGNATNKVFYMQECNNEGLYPIYLRITISDIGFNGIAWEGILTGDTFDILPIIPDPEAIYMPQTDAYFDNNPMESIYLVNETLQGIFSPMITFPQDIGISDLMQDGSGIFKTIIYFMSGNEEIMFGNFYEGMIGDIFILEESYNETSVEIVSDKEASYLFTYIENGYNDSAVLEGYDDPQNIAYNLTINFNISVRLNERNIAEQIKFGFVIEDDLINRTTDENIIVINMEMNLCNCLIYSDLHFNEIELNYDNQALINEYAEINVTITDSRVTALLYDFEMNLINNFTILNDTFNITYSEIGEYEFTLEIYHNEELNETIIFEIEFYEIEIPVEEPIEWYWLMTLVGTIITLFAVVFISHRD